MTYGSSIDGYSNLVTTFLHPAFVDRFNGQRVPDVSKEPCDLLEVKYILGPKSLAKEDLTVPLQKDKRNLNWSMTRRQTSITITSLSKDLHRA